jgi:glycosyltransferase involved in cell wall biosynthesis
MNHNLAIIICTYNRASILSECIEAIENQSITHNNYTLLIIDNNSKDNTYEVVSQFQKRYNNIEYYKETNQGLSHARNRGANEAETEWLVYLDDDGLAHHNFVEEAFNCFKNYSFDCFGGIYFPWHKYGKPQWLSSDFGRKTPLSDQITLINEAKLDGGIFAIKKSVLTDCGMFPTHLGMTGNQIAYGEETELQNKLIEKGYQLGFTPYWKMDHLVAKYKLSVKWHLKAEYAKGRDSMHILQKEPIHWNLIDKIKFILFHIIKGIKGNGKKVFHKGYYLQNLILDTLSPIYYRFGQQSK